MLNWTLRYLPVVEVLDQFDASTVLDVGSGWHGLSWYRPGPVVQTDLAFSGEPPAGRPIGAVRYVCASAERLPFRDGAFDYVVSLDLVEHLPTALRAAAIRELTRVAACGVVIGYPVGEDAARVDRRLDRALTLARRPVPGWLTEHLAQAHYPDTETLRGAVPNGWSIDREVALGNTSLLLAVSVAEHLPGLHRVARWTDRWYRRRGPVSLVNRGRTYRRMWILKPRAAPERDLGSTMTAAAGQDQPLS
jgi:SAM-dependent methyltransferase